MRRAAVVWLAATFCCAGADPVLQFSTYLGGSGLDWTASLAVAPDGSIWVAMPTNSSDLPVSSDAAQPSLAEGRCAGEVPRRCFDIWVAKLSASGQIVRSTYLGGSNDDVVGAIQLDATGNVWVAGTTSSFDFPRAKASDVLSGQQRTVVAKLSPDLKTVQQAIFGPPGPFGGFALDTAGAMYLAGANAISKSATSGDLVYTLSFGSATTVHALALDRAGRPIVAGSTEAGDLPGGGVRYGKRSGVSDGFVAKLAADGKSLVWARYLGGSDSESLAAMAPDAGGNLWLGGTTLSTEWFDEAPGGFLVKLSEDGASVLSARGVPVNIAAFALDASGVLWATGTCFPGFEATSAAFQTIHHGFDTGAFLLKLDAAGTTVWASYIGGSGYDRGAALAPAADGVVLAGATQSFDFPLNHAIQTSLHQQPDALPVTPDLFVMRFGAAPLGAPSVQPGGIVNAAGYRAGEAAPGSIVSIFGADLAAFIRQSDSLPLPPSLAGATVTVNGIAAPLFYASPSQINAQIPWETAAGTAQVQIRRGDAVSETRTLQIATASPGLFVDYRGWAAINSPSYSYLQPGDWLTLYATGLGPVDRPAANGAAPVDLSLLVTPPAVTLGSMPLEVTWAGLAPGLVGVYQVNAKLPADIGAGYRYEPLVVRVGDRASNAGSVGLAGRLN